MKITDLTVGQVTLLGMILMRPRTYQEIKEDYREKTGNEDTGGDLNELERSRSLRRDSI